MNGKTRAALAAAGLLGLAAGARGSSDEELPASATFVITQAGVSPRSARVKPGGKVTFVNDDLFAHQVASDPDPGNTDCPELNGPMLQPGQAFTTTVATTPAVCGFHGRLEPRDARLKGTLRVG